MHKYWCAILSVQRKSILILSYEEEKDRLITLKDTTSFFATPYSSNITNLPVLQLQCDVNKDIAGQIINV